MPLKEVVIVGYGQYDLKTRGWYPTKAELRAYDDDWDDWKIAEKELLLKRLQKGAKPETLYNIFKVPYRLIKETDRRFAGDGDDAPPRTIDRDEEEKPLGADSMTEDVGTTTVSHSREDPRYDLGRFSDLDFGTIDDMRFANRKWVEYEDIVDVSKPANQTTVEMMITMEVEYRAARRELQTAEPKKKAAIYDRMKTIREQYSKSATDVAVLEKQFKQAPKQENLDAVILRTHDIRPGWRDTEIERVMSRFNLFEKIDEFHKTSLEDRDEEEPRELKIPKPVQPGDRDVRAEIASYELAKSEGEEVPMAIGSDG